MARRLLPAHTVRLPRRGGAGLPDDAHGHALVIAAGRQAIAPARRLARALDGPVVAVLQPVVWRAGAFDLVWAPMHDRGVGPARFARNTLFTPTAPSPLTPADCEAAALALAERLRGAPPPRVGVLIGGPSRTHRFGELEAEDLAARLKAFAATHETSLLLATSPRTPKSVTHTLATRLSQTPHRLFDFAHEADTAAVYAGVLGASSALVVTSDSVAMLSEAAATGTPVLGWRLPGGKSKHEALYSTLEAHGAMRWFDGRYDLWTYEPLDAAEAIAARLRPILGLLPGETKRI